MKQIIADYSLLKDELLQYSRLYDDFCILDSCANSGNYDWIAGFSNAFDNKCCAEYSSFYDVENFFLANKGKHVFGHFNYDLKNKLENLNSSHKNGVSFNLFNFFVAELVFICRNNKVEMLYDDKASPQLKLFAKTLLDKKKTAIPLTKNEINKQHKNVKLKPRTGKEKYLDNFKKILNHIQLGDVYELNYCMEFFDDDAIINPVEVYKKLTELTEAPMSCFYKNGSNYLMCASPERFMKRDGNRLISQPIKGTVRRGSSQLAIGNWQKAKGNYPFKEQLAIGKEQEAKGNNLEEEQIVNCQLPIANFKSEDEELKSQLYHNEKERAENVMIVDLVRNDLSRIAEKGSVTVEELFGIYTFKTVHQMISTVSCSVRKEVTFTEILKALFPMGSMTGAPKIRAMQLIEDYEETKRGLFSGSVGYISPNGDFDFNVVIRSIFYNENTRYLSTWAGSAITINSDPEKEYEECMLKLQAMIKALE